MMMLQTIILKRSDIRKGSIDAIHSYGEKKDFTRSDALKTLEELKRNKCFPKLWVDHAHAKSNLCKHHYFGKGDVPTATFRTINGVREITTPAIRADA